MLPEWEPDEREPDPSARYISPFTHFRLDFISPEHYALIDKDETWSGLTGNIYEFVGGHPFSIILANYEDGTLLWLDDHLNDTDFEVFFHRERLSTWISDRTNELLNLLVATKLNYLANPKLIRTASDIPTLTELEKKEYRSSTTGGKELLLLEENLTSVANTIEPPSYFWGNDGIGHLRFFVWTQIYGLVLEINCHFDQSTFFSHQAEMIASSVGKHLEVIN
jgi:hypothetical protein